ncbi:MAG: ATP-dependent DNA ligase [Armatimonadota bacterium]|nr:ATP-dependent DNA ligase [Armatimonadota bacterium]MDR7503009.1 ATP-dependent DNA ligase [Armatimonadota bacterium]MDR7526677.1 ATP-dependent DNA ligase [Armatimonadota bacterium]MDR7575431.1 ATP-dependent DNA ligase [Armatimonadota bacterium]
MSLPFGALADLLEQVRATPRKLEKIALLARVFQALDDEDLRTAATFLTGAPFPTGDPRRLQVGWSALVEALQDLTGVDDATLHDAYLRHGDLGEVAEEVLGRSPVRPGAGLFDAHPTGPLTLQQVRRAFEAIAAAEGRGSRAAKVAALRDLFRAAAPREAKYLVKVMTSDMRVGLRTGLLEEAVAAAFAPGGLAGRRALLPLVRHAHMRQSQIGEVAVLARHGRLGEARLVLFRPVHFMLAETIFAPEEAFADAAGGEVLAEDKYDGIRAQVHVAPGRVAIFTRTLDEVTASFPDLVPDLQALARTCIADGEILVWRGERPLGFGLLQQRLRRKDPGPLVREAPVVFFAFDLLHLDGADLLDRPLGERRRRLEGLRMGERVRPSHAAPVADAAALGQRFREARDRGNEGVVVKRLQSPYLPGRRGRHWMKLKEELATLDVVVVAAEHGHGRRAAVLSDVTFAVRDGDRLRTIGKAYSGLTDQEIAELTRWFQAHTVRDLGRVKVVEPRVVLEVAFDAITRSDRHDSGYALRFPRIKRLRPDLTPAQISTLEDVRRLYERQLVRGEGAARARARA